MNYLSYMQCHCIFLDTRKMILLMNKYGNPSDGNEIYMNSNQQMYINFGFFIIIVSIIMNKQYSILLFLQLPVFVRLDILISKSSLSFGL